MKYLRKIVWLVIAVVFLASVIIGIGIIFSVKNVNVTLKSYTYSGSEEMEERSDVAAEINGIKEIVVGKYGGKLISYVNEDDLAECFADTGYILESCERVYPCTLNITVKERMELFVVADNGNYSTYDSSGKLMRSGLSRDEAVNKIDQYANIEICSTVKEEKITGEQIKDVAKVSAVFSEKFSALRSIVEKVELQSRYKNMDFRLRCGISVYITDYTVLTEAKIEAVYNEYMSLSGEEKLKGAIFVAVQSGSGEVVSYYDPTYNPAM